MYNKLFTKILDSSIWLEADATRIVWITLIAAMDEDGMARFSSIANLAHRARESIRATEKAVAVLEAPDVNSDREEHQGRRIERVLGGWLVLNAAYYRSIVTRLVSREQTRMRVQRYRERSNGDSVTGVTCVTCNAASVYDTASDLGEKGSPEGKRDPLEDFEEFWASLHKDNRIAKGRARDAWLKAIKEGASAQQMLAAVDSYKRYEKKRKQQNDYQPLHPTSWLNQKRFEDNIVKESEDNPPGDGPSIDQSIYG